jgi:hypothetical protein
VSSISNHFPAYRRRTARQQAFRFGRRFRERILSAATLEIDESALTGESIPTPKQVDAVPADAALGDRVDMAYMNCQVTRGAGTVLVVTTGMATEVGHISGMLQATTVEKTMLVLKNDIQVFIGSSDEIAKKDLIARAILGKEKNVVYVNVRVTDRPTWRGLDSTH